MADLTLHSQRVETVFDLLGDKEDDITYSVGWGFKNDSTAPGRRASAFTTSGTPWPP